MRPGFTGFDWDDGNREKCRKHGVSTDQVEALFLRPLMIVPDDSHSASERRYRGIGRTNDGRHVFVVFTIRPRGEDRLVRPISARFMHRKEVALYEEENPGLRDR